MRKLKKKIMRNIFFFHPNNVCLREDDIYSMVQYLNEMFFFFFGRTKKFNHSLRCKRSWYRASTAGGGVSSTQYRSLTIFLPFLANE